MAMCAYWDSRFGQEGKIWGMTPSVTAGIACELFRKNAAERVLVPGAGYGRNATLFARAGFDVTGVEVSAEALKLAEGDGVRYIRGSFLDVPIPPESFDAIYCYNVLHLFRSAGRAQFVARCREALRPGGLAFIVVFSEREHSYGKGAEVEPGTFESKPGRPVHYFTDADLRAQMTGFEIVETGLAEDPENHGDEGPHVHLVRYVVARRPAAHEFDGERYRQVSGHQREWGRKLIAGLSLRGDEQVLDLGCGDGTLTALLADAVPRGRVLGVDASDGMIRAAKPLERDNLRFMLLDIGDLDFEARFDLVFSNAALHWVKDHRRMLSAVRRSLKEGGRVRFSFGGDGNCQGFIRAVRSVMAEPAYSRHFEGFEWPWYMPSVDEYRKLVGEAGFRDVSVELENADRIFTEAELVGWIDQPSIVPFLENMPGPDRQPFRDEVVRRTMQVTAKGDGGYFETFRRVVVSARR